MSPVTGLRRTVAVLVLFASPWTSSLVSAQTQSRKTVLAVHWGVESHPANLVMDRAIREVLGTQSGTIDYFAEYLEADLFEPEESSQTLMEYLRRKYRDRRIDVVITTANNALRFVLTHQKEPLFAGRPLVFTVPTLAEAMMSIDRARFAAVLRGTNYADTLRLALELHPETERVFVVAQAPNNPNLRSVQDQLGEFSQRVTLTYVDEDTVPRLLEAIKAVPPRSLILYVWYTQQNATLVHGDDVARLVADVSPVPVYGSGDLYPGTGVVGGLVRATRPVAKRLGQMALQILDGTPPADIPIEQAPLLPIFDWRQLQRWGIDPSRLPEGSDIQFRTPGMWETYRSYIVVTVVVIAGQLALIAGLLVQRARRQHAEDELRRKETTVQAGYERIQQLNGRLISAAEATRSEIARELHDGVCQELVSIPMIVSTLKRSSGGLQDVQAQTALAKLEEVALGTIRAIRQLSHDLHPEILRLVGLEAALQGHCREVAQRHAVQVRFRADGDLGGLSSDLSLCLFRITQETLRNGVVHGHARRLAVSVNRSGDQIQLVVEDDGRGFDLEAVRREGNGLGLVSMEERARLLGGDMKISTRPGHGTIVRVRMPAGSGRAPQAVVRAAAELPAPLRTGTEGS